MHFRTHALGESHWNESEASNQSCQHHWPISDLGAFVGRVGCCLAGLLSGPDVTHQYHAIQNRHTEECNEANRRGNAKRHVAQSQGEDSPCRCERDIKEYNESDLADCKAK